MLELSILGGMLIASMICLFGFIEGYDKYERTCTPSAKKYGIASAVLFLISMLGVISLYF